MPAPTIDYLSARKNLRKGSDHSSKRAVTYAPDSQLDPCELTELECESAWSNYRIHAAIMWQGLFASFGIEQGYDLGETF